MTEPEKSNKNLILSITIGALSLIFGLWLSQQLFTNNDNKAPKNVDVTVLAQARPLIEFELIDQNQQAFTSGHFKGQWNFIFFGFTNCPDVCPTTFKIMQSVWKKLPTKQGEQGHPKLYFISVDPDRDQPETLKKYAEYFNPEFNALTGKLNELTKLTSQIGIMYGYEEKDGKDDKEYVVNHSAHIILIDPKGRMRAVISPPHIAKTIAKNFQTIRAFYGDK